MEELALSTQPLHHIDPLLAEIARVAAPQVLWELFLYGALWRGEQRRGTSDLWPVSGPYKPSGGEDDSGHVDTDCGY